MYTNIKNRIKILGRNIMCWYLMTRGVIMTLVIVCAFQLVSQILSHADHLVGWLNSAPETGRAWWQSGGAESFSGRVEYMVSLVSMMTSSSRLWELLNRKHCDPTVDIRPTWSRLAKISGLLLIVVLVHFSSVAQTCPTFCDPCTAEQPGFPIHHQFPELAQTHAHWVGDVI